MNAQKNLKELLEFGILNIDKPSGPTSFDVSDFVREKLNLRKTSHFGTLDPKVTGVLPIALNRACKLTGFFLGHDKEYIGIMRIHEDKSIKEIQEIINSKFLGKIKQTPPVKSRVKRQEREREIKKFELLEQNGKDILFKCEVQGGTYIRKLIDDLGKEIGGAHMLELRRTRAGIFSENDEKFINLYDLEILEKPHTLVCEEFPTLKNPNKKTKDFYDLEKAEGEDKLRKIIIPAEEVIKKIFPVVRAKENEIKKLFTGKPLLEKDLEEKSDASEGEIVCVFSGEKFIGVYKIIKSREIFAKPEFVLQPMK